MHQQVRIFALSKKEFADCGKVVDYFRNELPKKGYMFDLLKHRFKCVDDTLIYFQYDKHIIAKAITNERIDNELPIDGNSIEMSKNWVLTSALGVIWWRRGNPKKDSTLEKHVQQGALYIDPTCEQKIYELCFI